MINGNIVKFGEISHYVNKNSDLSSLEKKVVLADLKNLLESKSKLVNNNLVGNIYIDKKYLAEERFDKSVDLNNRELSIPDNTTIGTDGFPEGFGFREDTGFIPGSPYNKVGINGKSTDILSFIKNNLTAAEQKEVFDYLENSCGLTNRSLVEKIILEIPDRIELDFGVNVGLIYQRLLEDLKLEELLEKFDTSFLEDVYDLYFIRYDS